nr:YkgJ family cysteine cluster protein [Achromobacter mucicolens]
MGMSLTGAAPACRPECGACCIAPSITRPVPGMPQGKPAGVPCVQLLPDMRCAIFGDPSRPDFCGGLQPQHEMCGPDREHAIQWLADLERATAPCH